MTLAAELGSDLVRRPATSASAVALGPLDAAVRLELRLPPGAAPRDPTPLDLSSAPGVELDLQQAWAFDGSGRLEVSCVKAPASRWFAGLEQAVLDAASATARKAGGWASLATQPSKTIGDRLEQDFSAWGTVDGVREVARGRHLFGFGGQPMQVCLCTTVCAVPDHGDGSGSPERAVDCLAVLDSIQVEGFAAAPPPGLLRRSMAWAMAHPAGSVASLALGMLLVIALVLRRRPRPAP